MTSQGVSPPVFRSILTQSFSPPVVAKNTPKRPIAHPLPGSPSVVKNDPAELAPPSFTPSAMGTVESPLGQRIARRLSRTIRLTPDARRSLPLLVPRLWSRGIIRRSAAAVHPLLGALLDSFHFRDSRSARQTGMSIPPARRTRMSVLLTSPVLIEDGHAAQLPDARSRCDVAAFSQVVKERRVRFEDRSRAIS